jgi:hypothetical protein
MVGKQGLEPHLPVPKTGALTLTRHPVANCTTVEMAGIEPTRQRLQGATASLAATPRRRRVPSTRRRIGRLADPPTCMCSRYGILNSQACTRGSQGRQDSNPRTQFWRLLF